MTQKIKFGDSEVQLDFDFKKIKGPVSFLVLIFILFNSFYTVDANENAVILRLGKYYNTTMPGLQFKIPIVDKVYKVKVDYQYKEEFGFQTVKAGIKTQYSKRNFDHESWMLTGDLNIAEVRWIIQFKIKNAANYLFNVRDVENTIRDVAEATMRLMIGDRSFNEVLQSERISIAEESRMHMQKILDKYSAGISIQIVQLQGVHPPKPVEDSFNEVNRAKQEQETLVNEARQEYNKEIYKVEGETEKILNEAQGYAIERVNQAKGDAALFEMVLKEYNKAPQITKDRYFIETMNNVLSRVPNKIIVDSKLENLLPLLNLNNKEGK
tara:strand:- start:1697 stop:2671 length:975 start_codon:yes stop_codon:yes gene_type:complete